MTRMGVEALSTCLWEERQALEDLAYQLEAQQLVVSAGRHRMLPRATGAVETALAHLAACEAARATAARQLAGELGLAADANLELLAQALPEHAEALRSHRRRLRELLTQVDDLTRGTRGLLARNLAATTDALAILGVTPDYPAATPGTGGPPLRPAAALVDTRM